MKNRYIKFEGFKDITEPGLDGKTHRFKFIVGDAENEDYSTFTPIKEISYDVSFSGTLQSVWDLKEEDVPLYSGAIITNDIITSGGNPTLPSDYVLTTENAPESPPEKLNIRAGDYIKIDEETVGDKLDNFFHISLASKNASEIRDNINTLFKDLFGAKLFKIESERSLIDIYFPVQDRDSFSSRISALANLVTNIDVTILKSEMGEGSYKDGGSIYILEQFLKIKNLSQNDIEEVCLPLYNINNLRQSYPIHHDTSDKVLKAFDYFGLRYPINHFSQAWDTIIGKYMSSLKKLLELIQYLKYGEG